MNRGIKNEFEIVNVLNKKKIFELSKFFQDFIKELFPNISTEDIIYSDICNRYSKPDIYICVNGKMKYVSIKVGHSDSMHFESIKSFILFLRKQGISIETQKTILLYHYGDGTGDKRLLFDDIVVKYKNEILEANRELNKKEIIEKVFDRAVFTGAEGRRITVDYLYYGNKEYGVYCSKNELYDFVLAKNYQKNINLHIGPLSLQPYLRDINRVSKNLYKREMIQIKWRYLLADMQYARKKKN